MRLKGSDYLDRIPAYVKFQVEKPLAAIHKHRCFNSRGIHKEVLAQVEKSDFIYIDTPYQGVCGDRDSRYYSGINFDELVLDLEELNRKGIAFAVSYDGKRGDKSFGKELPLALNLKKIEIEVGRSSQATLLVRCRRFCFFNK